VLRVVEFDAGVVEGAAAEARPAQVGLDGVEDGEQGAARVGCVYGDLLLDRGADGGPCTRSSCYCA